MTEVLEIEGKFLSAEKLKLTEDQRCGLIKTLAYLEHGYLDHENARQKTGIPYFDMGIWGGLASRLANGRCASACCIGGTAEILQGVRYDARRNGGWALRGLFYPEATGANAYHATTCQAAVALRSYLETGRAKWQDAMKTPPYQKQRRK